MTEASSDILHITKKALLRAEVFRLSPQYPSVEAASARTPHFCRDTDHFMELLGKAQRAPGRHALLQKWREEWPEFRDLWWVCTVVRPYCPDVSNVGQ